MTLFLYFLGVITLILTIEFGFGAIIEVVFGFAMLALIFIAIPLAIIN